MEKKEAIDVNEEQADRFIREKMMEAADRYEQELNSDPALHGLKPSPQVFENIMAEIHRMEAEKEAASGAESGTETSITEKLSDADGAAITERLSDAPHVEEKPPDADVPDVEALLSEEDRRALEIGRKHMRHRGRFRMLRTFGVAAALVVVFGVSMVSEANRIRLMDAFNVLVGKEGIVRLGNEENRVIANDDEQTAYMNIQNTLNIKPVHFMYRPPCMEFEGYTLNEDMEMAQLFYSYNDTIFTVNMVNKEKSSSAGIVQDGKISDSFLVETRVCQATISEIESLEEVDYMAEFEYKNCYYKIYGILSREEFIEIIENIIFF